MVLAGLPNWARRTTTTLNGVTIYNPPLEDIRFVLDEIAELAELCTLEAFAHVDSDTVDGALAESARLMVDKVAPTNLPGDVEGSVWHEDGTVTTPPGLIDAYAKYVEAGWGAVAFDPEYGGAGFPWVVGLALQEMLTTANMAFSLCPLLTQGAIDAISHHSDETQREIYLPKMITGEWTGTMNLTEPQAGSDVGALRAKAEPNDDGTWSITGQKIFITWGEHDMAENIIHLVLARTPGAPPGTKGISCFIVPKYMVNDDGSLGEANDLRCVSIEHKLGINASPTCVMAYGDNGGATGFLIGEENMGMRYMFTMMNNARLSVGLEGLAVAERSYQQSAEYARDRLQGRAIGADKGESSPIIEHADVRRMLLTMKSHIEAMRGLLYLDAASLDRAKHGADESAREAATDLAALLTPISKSWSTDLGCELTGLGVQIFGGMGFVEETGVAQHLRDARIAPIYEGTNGIQAIDLVLRKLPMKGGAVVNGFLDTMGSLESDLTAAGGDFAGLASSLNGSLGELRSATTWFLENSSAPNEALAGATPYLRLFGNVIGGWVLAKLALAASTGDYDDAFAEEKLICARFYADSVLPLSAGLHAVATAGSGDLFALDASRF